MYVINPSKLPAELFVINRERVRKGLGVLRIEPSYVSTATAGGQPVGLHRRGSSALYFPGELFATQEEAEMVGRTIALAERKHEAAKYTQLCARLAAAYEACGGVQ